MLGPFDLCHFVFPRGMVRLMPRCEFIRIMIIKADVGALMEEFGISHYCDLLCDGHVC